MFSKFNIFRKSQSFDGHWFVYNTLRGTTAIISEKLKKHIDKYAECQAYVNQVRTLENLGIIVPDDFDEDASLRYWVNFFKYSGTTVDLTILTTNRCNLACSYCNQNGITDSKSDMDLDTCRQVSGFIRRFIKENRPEVLIMCFFGGEPLLNFPPIQNLAREVQEIAREKALRVELILVTNAVLLSPKITDELVNMKFKNIQVSLDGPERIHNLRRPFREKSKLGTYEVIVSNITYASEKLPVGVLVNLDAQNKDYIPELLDDLTRVNGGKLYVGFDFIDQSVRSKKHCSSHVFTDEEIPPYLLEAIRMARSRDLKVSNNPSFGLCTFENNAAVVIDPRGILYNCVSGVGIEEFKIGSVPDSDFIGLRKRLSQLVGIGPLFGPECSDCAYAPLCRGGCRYKALVRYGNFKKRVCRKVIMCNVYPELYGLIHEEKLQPTFSGKISNGIR